MENLDPSAEALVDGWANSLSPPARTGSAGSKSTDDAPKAVWINGKRFVPAPIAPQSTDDINAAIRKRDAGGSEHHKRELEEARRERVERWPAHFEGLGFPKRHIESLQGYPEWPDASKLENARRIVAKRGSILLLVGERGPGKTELAVMLTAELFFAGLVNLPRYWAARSLGEDRAAWNRRGYGSLEVDPYKLASRCPLLVLDDVHDMRDFHLADLTNIVDARYAAMRRTILISNQTPDGARQVLGESIWSRLAETGGAVHCDWPSFRTGGQG